MLIRACGAGQAVNKTAYTGVVSRGQLLDPRLPRQRGRPETLTEHIYTEQNINRIQEPLQCVI